MSLYSRPVKWYNNSKPEKGTSTKKAEYGVCSVCDKKGHIGEYCWKVIGYPEWHPLHKKQGKFKEPENKVKGNTTKGKPFVKTLQLNLMLELLA